MLHSNSVAPAFLPNYHDWWPVMKLVDKPTAALLKFMYIVIVNQHLKTKLLQHLNLITKA